MKLRLQKVEACMEEAEDIREAYDGLAHSQDQALLDCYGVSELQLEEPLSDEDSSDCDCDPVFPLLYTDQKEKESQISDEQLLLNSN